MFSLNNEALVILIFLAPGYISFRLYSVDRAWTTSQIINIFYGTLLFSTVNYIIIYYLILLITQKRYEISDNIIVLGALFVGVITGPVWKRFGHPFLHKILMKFRITNEDNQGDAWNQLFNNPNIYITQLIIKTSFGVEYMCQSSLKFDSDEKRKHGIFPYYADSSGAINIIPTHYRLDDESIWKEVENIEVDGWGTRTLHLKQNEISKIDVRVQPKI